MKSRHNPFLRITASAAIALSGIAHAGLTLYSETGPQTINEANVSLPGLNVTRGASGTGTLYFKYTVTNPASNYTTEPAAPNYYFAAMQFYEGGTERLGIGNGWDAWAYGAFNTSIGDVDLKSAAPEPSQTFQYVRSTDVTTFVYKVNFNSGADDNITVWLNPNQAATEGSQSSSLTTSFNANATFTDILLREGGSGNGWTFSNIAIAGSFADLSSDTSIKAPETQVFTDSVNLTAKSIFEWNLDGDAPTTRGTGGYDAVNIAGSLTGSDAAFKVLLHDDSFTNPFWDTDQSWSDIFKANADGSGSAFDIASLFSSITGDGIVWDSGTSRGNVAGQGYFSLSGTSLNWTAVPEPTSALAGLLLTAGILRRRR